MLIKGKLRRKKVLLVLDDVDDADQLEALAGSPNWFKEGSRIIITTSDQDLPDTHGVNVVYKIILLSDDEVMKLFHKHALRHGNHIEDYDSLSKEVVLCAGGLPLALKVLGKFLDNKDKSEWVSALASLKGISRGKILEQLKISYNGLEPLVKELFLEIACFFRRESLKEATEIPEACGLPIDIGVKELKQKALITVTKEGTFDMHDLMQEMGHRIVREKYPRNPEKHSKVWRLEDVVTICALPLEENHWIEALKIWDPMGGWAWGKVPRVVANMKELRWFSWIGYPAASLPINFQPTKLCYLRLQSSSLKQLWKGEKIQMKMDNMKELSLVGTRIKVVPSSIGKYCTNLYSLDVRGCSSLESIEGNFHLLKHLKKEDALPGVTSLPDFKSTFPKWYAKDLATMVPNLDKAGIDLLNKNYSKGCIGT